MSHTGPPLPPPQRFGYRGRALTLVGAVWVLIGISVALSTTPDETFLLHEQLPDLVRIVLWVGAGVCAFVTAWWPPGADRFGFMALIVPAAIRAASYAFAAGIDLITTWTTSMGLTAHPVGDSGRWVDASAWTIIVCFVLLLADWPEVTPPSNDASRP